VHSLLRRQLRRFAGSAERPPEDWAAFVEAVDRAYSEADADRAMVERSMDLMSQELQQQSERLSRERVERARSEAAQENAARMNALLSGLPDLIFRLTADGVFVDFHAGRVDDLFGPPERIVGATIAELLPPELAARCLQLIHDTLASGATQLLEYQLQTPNGTNHFEARSVATGKSGSDSRRA
jgi:PAS domain-containing protein